MVGKVAKWERVRRLRYGCLIRLFRHRYGYQLPDDDAGREDLWLLLQNVSLASAGSEKKVRAAIETWATWLSDEEARERIEFLGHLTTYERTPTARELGERLGVTNAEREALKLWQFKPIDMTDEELAEQRRTKARERRKAAREKLGRPSRDAYLAKFESKQRPWEALGIHRRTWERRRAAPSGAIIVSKVESLTAASIRAESQPRGIREVELGVSPETEATRRREVESQRSGSSGLRHRQRHAG